MNNCNGHKWTCALCSLRSVRKGLTQATFPAGEPQCRRAAAQPVCLTLRPGVTLAPKTTVACHLPPPTKKNMIILCTDFSYSIDLPPLSFSPCHIISALYDNQVSHLWLSLRTEHNMSRSWYWFIHILGGFSNSFSPPGLNPRKCLGFFYIFGTLYDFVFGYSLKRSSAIIQ